MRRLLLCTATLLVGFARAPVADQPILGPGAFGRGNAQLAPIMARIAVAALAQGAGMAPDDRLRLELAGGRYQKAEETLAELRRGRTGTGALMRIRWEMFVKAKLAEAQGEAFGPAFRHAAADRLRSLDPLAAYIVLYSLGTPLHILDQRVDDALATAQSKATLSRAEAISLVGNWELAEAYHQIAPELSSILDADDRRRYEVTLDIPVRTPDGATICAYVVRPRISGGLPALLNFTIYADRAVNLDNARLTAAHGYAAVVGFTRGKACSPNSPEPLDHVGADADTLIDWIAAQSWSNGQVGMYGGSYEGFAQWAAAKHPPMALKALMPAVSFSPGTDFPMEGGILMTYALPWPFYTTDNKGLDDATYHDSERWVRLQRSWYLSGRPYRDLTRIDGQPNPIFDGWLAHPDFDAYWRGLIPTDDELKRLDIPVLTTTGYYDSGQIGALSYLLRRERLNPAAEQYLVIGPYDHRTGQLGTISPLGSEQPILRGYDLDPVAQIDIMGLRYAWFDYVLRGAPKPAILQGRVNYELMGENVWKHASSIANLGDPKRRLYLRADGRLSDHPAGAGETVQLLGLADRTDAALFAPSGHYIDQSGDEWPIVSAAPNLANIRLWMSEPFKKSTDIAGLFAAHLELIANKKDFDFAVTLFEQTIDGKYIQLSYLWQRASYALDRTRRNLLKPNDITKLEITAGRLTGRQMKAGSRLVVAISLLKQPGEQINYGTGKPIGDESIADASSPLRVRWLSESYIAVPNVR